MKLSGKLLVLLGSVLGMGAQADTAPPAAEKTVAPDEAGQPASATSTATDTTTEPAPGKKVPQQPCLACGMG